MLEKYRDLQPDFYEDIMRSVVKNGKISHAYLIETNGFADCENLVLTFAKLLLCSHPAIQQCDSCNICHLIDENHYADLMIIRPDGASIKKEQLMKLQADFRMKSSNGGRRVYIIFDADKLNPSSANTILKFLEEPEENIVAILVTEHRYQVLTTILSRCQVFSLRGNGVDAYENVKIDDLSHFLELTYQKKQHILAYLSTTWYTFCKEKKDYQECFQVLEQWYVDFFHHYNDTSFFQQKYGQAFSYVFSNDSIDEIIRKTELIHQYQKYLKYNVNLKLCFDAFLVQWMEE